MTTLTGGDIIVETLAREKIKHVFSIPGGQLLTIYDAIRVHPDVDMIVPRHEGASALMACGYALASGRPSVVMSTVGAGVIYEAGGLLFAWRERLPVVSIAPQVQSYRMKPIQESLQACDQDTIFKPFTKFGAIIYHYDRIPQLVRRAIKVAAAPEPGPVHLDVPVDVLFEFHRVSGTRFGKLFPGGSFRFEGEIRADEAALEKGAELIRSAKRPLALVGRGVRNAGADLMKLLQAAVMPVLTSEMAFSSVSSDYDLKLGVVDMWEDDEAIDIAAQADVILIFEADENTARFAQVIATKNSSVKVIQSAELAAAVSSVVPADVGIVGTPGAVLNGLSERVSSAAKDEGWFRRLMEMKSKLEKEYLIALGPGSRVNGVLNTIGIVSELLRPEDYVVCDGPLAARAAMLKLKHPGLGRVVPIADDYIPGAGLPVALGIKAAAPKSKVFFITETSRMKRHSREFQTASRYKLPVTGFVFQDKDKKPDEEVNFAEMAKSLGVQARTITDPVEEITKETVTESFSKDSGMLFDVSSF